MLNRSVDITPCQTKDVKRGTTRAKKSKSKDNGLNSHVIKKVMNGKSIIKISVSDIDPMAESNAITVQSVQYIVENEYDDLLNATERLMEKIVKKLSEDISYR